MVTSEFSYDLSTEAEYLRQHPSAAESVLLEEMTALKSFDFEFQSIVEGTIIQFYFEKNRLAVLLEDESHDHSDGYYRHLETIKKLEGKGLKVLILPAYDILQNSEKSIDKITTLCKST